MTEHRYTRPLMSCCIALLAATASLPAFSERSALPPVREEHGIRYVSGGIGCDEAIAMRSESTGYPLTLMFFERVAKSGMYLAAIPVSITDAAGKPVLHVVADGPYLLVDLPDGDYVVNASYKEQLKTVPVRVRAHRHTPVQFEWQGSEPSPGAPTTPIRHKNGCE